MHLTPQVVGTIGVLYGFAQIAGGIFFGTMSEKWGRKRAIVDCGTAVAACRYRRGPMDIRR